MQKEYDYYEEEVPYKPSIVDIINGKEKHYISTIAHLKFELAKAQKEASEYLGNWTSAVELASYRQLMMMLGFAGKATVILAKTGDETKIHSLVFSSSKEKIEEQLSKLTEDPKNKDVVFSVEEHFLQSLD